MYASQLPKNGKSTVLGDTTYHDNASDTSTVQVSDSESTMVASLAVAKSAVPKRKASYSTYSGMFKRRVGMKRANSPIEDDSEDEQWRLRSKVTTRAHPNYAILRADVVSEMSKRLSEAEEVLSQVKERVIVLENERKEFLGAKAKFGEQSKCKAGFGTFQETERVSTAAYKRTTVI